MSESTPRPRQATLAGWLIMVGSVVLVLSAFERVSGLTSLESQETLRGFLDKPPGDGLGIGLESLETIVRVMCLVAAATATASAILGFQVLQRSRSARVVLSALAPVLVIAGAAITAFLGSLVAAGIAMLWLQPTRSWFRHEPAPQASGSARESDPFAPPQTSTPPPARPDPTPTPTPSQRTPAPTAQAPVTEPRPMVGFGTAEIRPQVPLTMPEHRQTGPSGPRPPALVGACVLTWVFSGLAIAMLAISVLVMLAIPDVLFDELRRQDPDLAAEGFTDERIRAATYVVAAIFVPWCLGAIAVAIFAFRRAGWARRVLLGSSAAIAAFCLLGALGNLVLALPLVACLVTVGLLLRGDVRQWFG